MYKLFIASRYLRSRAISLVTIIGIFLSVGALIVVISVMSGFLRESKSFIRGTMADIVVVPFSTTYELPDGSEATVRSCDFDTIRRVIQGVDGVTGVAPRFTRIALIRRGDGRDSYTGVLDVTHYAVQAVGIDLECEREVTNLGKYLSDADEARRVEDLDNPFFLPQEMRDVEFFTSDFPCALVGHGRYGSLGLRKGDVITLATLDEEDIATGTDIKPFEQKFFVAGAVKSGHHQFDNQTILISLEDAWSWVGADGDVSEVYVAVDDYVENGERLALAIHEALQAAGIGAYTATWEQRNAILLGAVQNERTILGFILGFFILIATFNVFATTAMMVTDKTKDIGILVSMGATPGGIMGIFMTCGVLMWLIGSSLGSVGGYLFARNINAVKDFIERTLNVEVFNTQVYNFTEIPVEIDGFFVAATLLGTLVLCLFFSFLPALRASLMDPVETLRHE